MESVPKDVNQIVLYLHEFVRVKEELLKAKEAALEQKEKKIVEKEAEREMAEVKCLSLEERLQQLEMLMENYDQSSRIWKNIKFIHGHVWKYYPLFVFPILFFIVRK
jgi:hypothetical protein